MEDVRGNEGVEKVRVCRRSHPFAGDTSSHMANHTTPRPIANTCAVDLRQLMITVIVTMIIPAMIIT